MSTALPGLNSNPLLHQFTGCLVPALVQRVSLRWWLRWSSCGPLRNRHAATFCPRLLWQGENPAENKTSIPAARLEIFVLHVRFAVSSSGTSRGLHCGKCLSCFV